MRMPPEMDSVRQGSSRPSRLTETTLEIDARCGGRSASVRQREIAEDAALDLVALGIDGDRFRHRHRTVFRVRCRRR
jgi:hypothetical protein